MKKQLLFLLSLIMTINASGQAPIVELCKTDSVYYYRYYGSSSSKYFDSREFFEYDANGNVLLNEYQLRDTVNQIWIPSSKNIHQYDANNNNTLAISQTYNTSLSQFVNASKTERTFDANSNQTSRASYSWSSIDNAWTGTNFKETNLFNTQNLKVQTIFQNWVNGAWLNFEKDSLTYYSNNLRHENIKSNWDTLSASWKPLRKDVQSYNSNDKLTEIIYQSWNSSSQIYVNSFRYSYQYNTSNNRTEFLSQQWNGTSSSWVNHTRQIHSYDSNQNEISMEEQSWDGSAWIGTYRLSYTYNSSGKMIEKLDENANAGVFENYLKETRDYDANGNLTEIYVQIWVASGSTWRDLFKHAYGYNSNDLPVYYENFNFNQSENRLVNSLRYDYEYNNENRADNVYSGSSWNIGQNFYQTRYHAERFCTLLPASISEDFYLNNIKIYPNPAGAILNVELPAESAVEIFSIQGSLMALFPAREFHQIDISTFPKGIYLLKAGSSVKKFVKQ
jgi:hypothetical protein